MARTHRSAITGRYITPAATARHPRTSVTESGANHNSGTRHRSAATGHYVTLGYAARNPKTTITERSK